MTIDLHFHTNRSDGKYRPDEIPQRVSGYPKLLIATDHDYICVEARVAINKAWIRSSLWVEISADWAEHSLEDLHLVAYSKWFQRDFDVLLYWIRDWKRKKIRDQIDKLADNWFPIAYDHFVQYFSELWINTDNLNSFSIAKYLLSIEENVRILTSLFWKKPTISEVIRDLLKLSWKYAELWTVPSNRFRPNVQEISLVTNSDDIFGIAHPNITFKSFEWLRSFIESNVQNWINSIEINSTAPEQWVKYVIETWNQHKLLFTFWSDFHESPDQNHGKIWDMNPYLAQQFINYHVSRLLERI